MSLIVNVFVLYIILPHVAKYFELRGYVFGNVYFREFLLYCIDTFIEFFSKHNVLILYIARLNIF